MHGVKQQQIQEIEDGEADYELSDPNKFFGANINLIPLHSAVQAPRLFYGARFYNQALPLVNPEEPWVQNATADDPERSYDQEVGNFAGSIHVGDDDDGAEVIDVTPDKITLRDLAGKKGSTSYTTVSFSIGSRRSRKLRWLRPAM